MVEGTFTQNRLSRIDYGVVRDGNRELLWQEKMETWVDKHYEHTSSSSVIHWKIRL
jgi:hypothetical protein